jgi:membrane protease YdiL (CAAX protease family)
MTTPAHPRRWALGASAGAALAWAGLVAHAPTGFFVAAAVFCLLWIPLSAAAAPPGLAARLRPGLADVGLGLLTGVLLFGGSRAFLWTFCGGLTDALCAPTADLFGRFQPRGLAPALVLTLLVAPAEELFWRGVVQAWLTGRFGAERALPLAVLAASGVALASGEPLLALATLPTYAVWGALTAWRGSLVPALVSHATWTLLVAAFVAPR